LVGKSEGKGPLRRTKRRWEDNIKTVVNWIHTAQEANRW